MVDQLIEGELLVEWNMVHQVHVIMVVTVILWSCGNLYCNNNNSFHKHTCCDYTNNNYCCVCYRWSWFSSYGRWWMRKVMILYYYYYYYNYTQNLYNGTFTIRNKDITLITCCTLKRSAYINKYGSVVVWEVTTRIINNTCRVIVTSLSLSNQEHFIPLSLSLIRNTLCILDNSICDTNYLGHDVTFLVRTLWAVPLVFKNIVLSTIERVHYFCTFLLC